VARPAAPAFFARHCFGDFYQTTPIKTAWWCNWKQSIPPESGLDFSTPNAISPASAGSVVTLHNGSV